MTKYVVIGAGIIGLYTTYHLLQKGVDPREITIIAKFWPGDESIEYTSPYAGGNFLCITGDDQETLVFDKTTYLNLGRLQRELGGPQCGLDLLPSWENWETKPSTHKIESLKLYLKDYQEVNRSDLPHGATFGIKFTTWCFNCPKFLTSFKNYLVDVKGVVSIRKELTHVLQAFLSSNTKIVFNCSGIGSRSLGGVADTKVYPTRGQVVVIKAPHIQQNKFLWLNDLATYIIKRPYSHDQLILGGFLQKDDWRASTYKDQTADILERTTKLLPEILEGNAGGQRIEDLEILRVAAGLRPSRHGGVRIEREPLDEGKVVIHNYGASGYGYQAGYGMSEKAVGLAMDRLKL